jgi:hypothetical protein
MRDRWLWRRWRWLVYEQHSPYQVDGRTWAPDHRDRPRRAGTRTAHRRQQRTARQEDAVTARRPKDIGTAAETAVVRYLRTAGFPHAERRSLRGTKDAGDITGTPGICWEVKGGAAARLASDGQVSDWLNDTDTERVHARAEVGVLVLQRKGIGAANAGRWWAIMPGWQYEALCASGTRTDGLGGLGRWCFGELGPVRIHLAQACPLLTHAGYGTPEGP